MSELFSINSAQYWLVEMGSLLRGFINSQRYLSSAFDKILPESFRRDGNRTFGEDVLPDFLKPDLTVVDVGGGKNPCVTLEEKKQLNISLTGIDIDRAELDLAPAGLYDRTLAGDIANLTEFPAGDLVVCRAVLEHVRDVTGAFNNLRQLVRPGGHILIFVPSRNAWYARLSLLLPEALKRRLLFTIEPGTEEHQGFPSYYDCCTPREFRKLAEHNQLVVEYCLPFYRSWYFSFFFPLYFIWRIWIVVFRLFYGEQAAETFIFVLKRQED